jgi:hypothetical protein
MATLNEPIDSSRGQGLNDLWYYQNPVREAAIALSRIAPNDVAIKRSIEMLSTGKPDEPGIPERWISAAAVLGEIGPRAGMAIPAMITALNQLLDSKKEMPGLYQMVDAIVRCSPHPAYSAATVAVLVRMLDPKYQSSGIRSSVAEILGRIGRAAAPALPRLKELQNETGLFEYTRNAAAASVVAIEADLKLNASGGSAH